LAALAEFERFHGIANVQVIDLAGRFFEFPQLDDPEKLAGGDRHPLVFVIHTSKALDLGQFVRTEIDYYAHNAQLRFSSRSSSIAPYKAD